MTAMLGMMNPQQKQIANNLKGMNKEQQCNAIAEACNKNGISKEQLESLLKTINGY